MNPPRRDSDDIDIPRGIRMKGLSGLNGCLILLLILSLIGCMHGPATAGTVEKDRDPVPAVEFPAEGLNLKARLTKPEGGGPFPAVVLLHGCSGMQWKRDHLWARRLWGWGYVAFQVDSFRPRGISSVCTYSGPQSTDILRRRVADAYAAKRYLAGLPFVSPDRIAVMGWSHGGSTTLQVLSSKTADPFRAAVAFYPGCRSPLTGLNAPLLILIGGADDWTPADRCEAMMPRERAANVTLKVYPGAHHGFDTPGANRDTQGSRGMHHIQHHPEAEADATAQVRTFLETRLK